MQADRAVWQVSVTVATFVVLVVGVGCGAMEPRTDSGEADGASDAIPGTDAVATDAGTDAAPGSDAGPPVPPGCGIQAIDLNTLGFDDSTVPATVVDAVVLEVLPDRLRLMRADTGGEVLFRFAGPDLGTAFSVSLVTQIRRVVDAGTASITDVVSVAGASVAVTVLNFGQNLSSPPSGASGTGLSWSLGAVCNWPDHRETCGLPPEQVTRREVLVNDPGTGTTGLWAGDQVLVGTWTVRLVDAVALPGYAQAGCTLGQSAYFGMTLLATP